MEANEFVEKLKASESNADKINLEKAYGEFHPILSKLGENAKKSFALNVLCILCRNLEKISKFRSNVDYHSLLLLTIDCLRATRTSPKEDAVKCLACLYHIHRHVVKQNINLPPQLVFKLSYMAFEDKNIDTLKDNSKTFWNILADRIAYIEKLKSTKIAINKLLPQLKEDIQKVLKLYDIATFCGSLLLILFKKLFFLYSDIETKKILEVFNIIYSSISAKDLKKFKTLKDGEINDLYVKFLDSFYIVAEVSSKVMFNSNVLMDGVRTAITIFGHRSDIFHCLQNFYQNSVCNLLTSKMNKNYTVAVLCGLIQSCEVTEKLGYEKIMITTYPYLNQLLRLFLEFISVNATKVKWRENFDIDCQEKCFAVLLFLVKKLRKTEQLLKCENCTVKTGLHDALRLTFSAKNLVSVSLSENLDVANILSGFYSISVEQHVILEELKRLGCVNHEKCLKKVQTDIHNSAILLNKSKNYDFSIKLFELYLHNEIKHQVNELDLENISRAYYNKSICELDYKLYEPALDSAYLSFIFGEESSADKHISLVIDIKAKVIKNKTDTEDNVENINNLQVMTVLDACKKYFSNKKYEISKFISNLSFCQLLRQEFNVYAKFWPSVTPIAGIWKSYVELLEKKHRNWLKYDNENNVLWFLYKVILKTPAVVRSIHTEEFKVIINKLLNKSPNDIEEKIVYSVLLLLKCDFNLLEASLKYEWKITDQILDPDQIILNRTVPHEHEALIDGVKAVKMLMEVLPDIKMLKQSNLLHNALQICAVFVPLLLHACKMIEGLQLAHICCEIADVVGNKEQYLHHAGYIISHAQKESEQIQHLLRKGSSLLPEMMFQDSTQNSAIMFVCDAAIFYSQCGSALTAAHHVQYAQAMILSINENKPEINLDTAIGRLLQAQVRLYGDGESTLSALMNVQRYYVSISNTAPQWTSHRFLSLHIHLNTSQTTLSLVSLCKLLRLLRRGRATSVVSLPSTTSVYLVRIIANIIATYKAEDCQVKIDNRLKHILGLLPTYDTQPNIKEIQKENIQKVPKLELEAVRDAQMLKKSQVSPKFSPCTNVPKFKRADFMTHSNCNCYACQTPFCFILACQTCGLEASMYFRSKEPEIAKNYFEGAIVLINLTEIHLNNVITDYKLKFDEYLADIVKNIYYQEFYYVQIEILIEYAHFELSLGNYSKSDEFVIKIHEIMQEIGNVNLYVKNEVGNLVCASAQLRKFIKNDEQILGIETEFDSLKLSPEKVIEPVKTPENKLKDPPKLNKPNIVDPEELPSKRRVIKLNLDDTEETPKAKPKKTEFKIPVPKIQKATAEMINPRPSRLKPSIIIRQATEESNEKPSVSNICGKNSVKSDVKPSHSVKKSEKSEQNINSTPVTKNRTEFFTPMQDEENEEFFTPMSTIKTYTKKTLQNKLIKNLEKEFLTPKAQKENVEACKERKTKVETSLRCVKDKRTLKRATSPGKLEKEDDKVVSRSRRQLRQPRNYSLDDKK